MVPAFVLYRLQQHRHRSHRVDLMRIAARLAPAFFAFLVAACGDGPTDCCMGGASGLRVINAFTAPVDVLIDGTVAVAGLAAGTIDTVSPAAGAHTLMLRPSAGASASQSITTSAGALNT